MVMTSVCQQVWFLIHYLSVLSKKPQLTLLSLYQFKTKQQELCMNAEMKLRQKAVNIKQSALTQLQLLTPILMEVILLLLRELTLIIPLAMFQCLMFKLIAALWTLHLKLLLHSQMEYLLLQPKYSQIYLSCKIVTQTCPLFVTITLSRHRFMLLQQQTSRAS